MPHSITGYQPYELMFGHKALAICDLTLPTEILPNYLRMAQNGPAEKHILLDSLLFKLVSTSEKEMALLAIPQICTDKINMLYHSSLFKGHQGVVKTYLTVGDKFFIPG